MGGRCIPERPDFVHPSERIVWESLRRGLRGGDVLMHGVRLTDPADGDVEIDLLVLMPDVGLAVIEVKGGHVTYSDGSLRQTDGDESRPIDPVAQARKGMYALGRYVDGVPTWSRGGLRSGWLIALPHTPVDSDLGPQARRDVVIGAGDLEDAMGRVYDQLRRPALTRPVPADGWVDDLVDLLRGAADAPVAIATRAELRMQRLDQLTEAQGNLLSFISPNPRYEVTGAAGTGKTWLALEQARRWQSDGHRVCFVTYGRGVAQMVASTCAAFPRRHQPSFVGTFHQLGVAWGVRPDSAGTQEHWTHEIPSRMLEAAGRLADGDRFTAFVVDEAQDFGDLWWPALLASARDSSYRLAVFRDDEQAVFADRRGRPDIPLVPFRLERNVRNARPIVDAVRPLLARSVTVTSTSGDGMGVRFVAAPAGTEIFTADDTVDRLIDEGWLPSQVALLTTKHRHPVQKEHEDREAYWSNLSDPTMVFYSTVAGFKGLERAAIVLVVDGFHEGIEPAKVMYTGMTRARDLLVVVGDPALVSKAIGDAAMRRLQGGS